MIKSEMSHRYSIGFYMVKSDTYILHIDIFDSRFDVVSRSVIHTFWHVSASTNVFRFLSSSVKSGAFVISH